MIGDEPIYHIYQDILLDKIAAHGFTDDEIQKQMMISKLPHLAAQTVLLELLHEQYYPVTIDEHVVIVLLSKERTVDVSNFCSRYEELLASTVDLGQVKIDKTLNPVMLVYLLSLWFTQIYGEDAKIFFGDDPEFIDEFNKSLKAWNFEHYLMPFFPVMLLIDN